MSAAKVQLILSSHSSYVYSVCFARNRPLLISGSADNTVKLWNVGNGELIHTFVGHSNWLFSVVFSPNSQLIASGSADQTVKVWEVATKSLIGTLEYSSEVIGVKFSTNGLLLASRNKTTLELVSLL